MFERKSDLVWLAVVLVVLLGFLPALVWALWGGGMLGMMGMMGFGWGSMFLIPLAFLVLVGVGAYYLIIEFTRAKRPALGQGNRALMILNERYAKGEITKEQYLNMKKELAS